MAKTNYQSAEEYISTFDAEVQNVLNTVRRAILAGLPEDAEEVISYQIPAVKYHGFVFYYSAHTKHYSLSTPPPFAAFTKFAEQLSPYERSTSAVRFPLDQAVPTQLITDMARYQAEQNVEREAAKKK